MSVLELAVPVWSPGLTKDEVKQIERVQKVALHIILGNNYINYPHALGILDIESLSTRREALCLKFAKQSAKSSKYQQWFSLNESKIKGIKTRSKKKFLKPVFTRTRKYENSTIPYITNILNECSWSENEQLFM